MKKVKTWKQRIFASLVAVCMVITLVPATAMAAGETAPTEVPGLLVTGVMEALPNPSTITNQEELGKYGKNMGMISHVDYDQASGTITVTANRSGMEPYKSDGGGWQTYYALVMNFGDKQLITDTADAKDVHIKAEGGCGINEGYNAVKGKWEGGDIKDADCFVPGYAADEYKNPVVFWLNAAKDTCEFTLKYTAPNQKAGEEKVETQKITVKINDTSKLVQSVDKSKLDARSGSATEDKYYKTNLAAIEDIAYDAANGTITVTADRGKMEQYYFQRGAVTEKKVFYALSMNFKNYLNFGSDSGELNEEKINVVDGYEILDSDRDPYQDEANKYVPDRGEGVKRGDTEEPIIFWFDAKDNTRSFTLCRETTTTGQTPKVVARATQKITINVVDSPDSITPTITLDKTNATIKKGESLQLAATKSHDDARIEWDSDDNEIAIVDKNGLVAAREAGDATITATLIRNGNEVASATCDIKVTDDSTSDDPDDPIISGTVTPQEAAIALDKTKATIYVKAKTQNTVRLKAIVLGKSEDVTWKSSKPKIATVKNGKVTAKKAGKTTITATANGVSAQCVVTVKKPTLKLTKKKATIKKGKMVQIKVKATPQGGKIKYKSNKKKVATVNADGLVTGKKKGTAKITVTANGVKKTFTVKVK